MGDDKKGWFVVALATAYVLFLAFNFDKLAETMRTAPFWNAIAIYIIGNPGYILIIYFMIIANRGSEFKGVISGILLVIALDIINFPRLGSSPADLISAAAATNSDSIFMNLLISKGLEYTTAWWIYYAAIPIAIILLIALVMGAVQFSKQVNGLGRA